MGCDPIPGIVETDYDWTLTNDPNDGTYAYTFLFDVDATSFALAKTVALKGKDSPEPRQPVADGSSASTWSAGRSCSTTVRIAWIGNFGFGGVVSQFNKPGEFSARAVRGGPRF